MRRSLLYVALSTMLLFGCSKENAPADQTVVDTTIEGLFRKVHLLLEQMLL